MSLGIGRYKLGTNMLCGVGRHAGSQSCDAPCLVTDTRASDLSVDVAVNAALWPRLTPGAPGGPGEGAEAGQPSAEGKIMVPSQSGGPCRASLCLQKAEKAGVSQPQGPWLPAPCHCPPGREGPTHPPRLPLHRLACGSPWECQCLQTASCDRAHTQRQRPGPL